MVPSLTNVAGWMARLVLSAAVLCFNEPRFVGPDAWARSTATEHVDTARDSDKSAGFHATLTVGEGKRQFTVEFGHSRERGEDEVL